MFLMKFFLFSYLILKRKAGWLWTRPALVLRRREV